MREEASTPPSGQITPAIAPSNSTHGTNNITSIFVDVDEASLLWATMETQSKQAQQALFSTLADLDPKKNIAQYDIIVAIGKLTTLAELYPSSFKRAYKFEFWVVPAFPLSVICTMNGVPQDLLEAVYAHHPASARDALGWACFYATDKEGGMDALRWLHTKSPNSICRFVDGCGYSLLHYALRSPTSCLEVVKFIHQACAEGQDQKIQLDYTPLHCAFQFASLAIVQYLLGHTNANQVLSMEDDQGFNPLYYAFLNKREEVAQVVVKTYPTFFTAGPDPIHGWLPLHYACVHSENDCGTGVKVLLEYFPEAAKHEDKEGCLPLALACRNTSINKNYALLELIVRCHPDAVNSIQKDLIESKTPKKLIKHMANARPSLPDTAEKRRKLGTNEL